MNVPNIWVAQGDRLQQLAALARKYRRATSFSIAPAAAPDHAEETPYLRLDRLMHASAAPLTAGLSPVSLSLALADWAWHLAASPGHQEGAVAPHIETRRAEAIPAGRSGKRQRIVAAPLRC